MTSQDSARMWSPVEFMRAKFGAELPAAGVVHTAAVARHNGRRVVLRIGQDTPKSEHDYFALQCVRAWADVVLTSGAILRAEPDLSFAIDGPNAYAKEALTAWRGDRPPLEVAVLSSGLNISGPLPRLCADHPVTVYTPTPERDLVALNAVPRGVRIVSVSDASPRAMVRWASDGSLLGDRRTANQPGGACSSADDTTRNDQPGSDQLGSDGPGSLKSDRPHWALQNACRVAVELGPSTAATLYETPCLVDRLVLGEYGGPLPNSVIGGAFVADGVLEKHMRPLADASIQAGWRFQALERIA